MISDLAFLIDICHLHQYLKLISTRMSVGRNGPDSKFSYQPEST